MTLIFKKLLKYWPLVLLAFIGLLIQTFTELQLPNLMADIVDNGIGNQDTAYILAVGLQMIGYTVISILSTILVSFLAAKIAASISKELRNEVFIKVENFSLQEFNQFSSSSLITRTTNDVQQVQMLTFMLIRMAVMAPMTAIGGIIMAISKSITMTQIIFIGVLALLGMLVLIAIIVIPNFQKMQKFTDKLNLIARENLSGLRVIKAFTTEEYQEAKFEKANKDVTKTGLFVNRVSSILNPGMSLILNFTILGIVFLGAQLVDTGGIQVGDVMAFVQYVTMIIMAFLMLSMMFIMIPRAGVSAKRIKEVLDTEVIIVDPEVSKNNEIVQVGTLEFKNVTFSYPNADEAVLSDINFKAKKGDVVAFIGSTGSGKSTLINLIPRFYDVTSGEILIDGVNIKDITQHELRSKIGYVPQKGVLFSGDIEYNLKYGLEDIDQTVMEQAAKTAQAYDFISEKDDKFKSHISQGGTNVSGGQKQRLSIARALVRKPEFLIFDDSFSALDFKTDARLREALNKDVKGTTVLIVAQRIATIMHANQIIVLSEGKIVGKGKHHELLKNCEVYHEIAHSQLSKEELEHGK